MAGCAPRAQLVLVPEALSASGDIRQIFIGTSRINDPQIGFGADRTTQLAFARYDISVPPNRSLGQISWPGRQVDPETQFVATAKTLYPEAGAFRQGLRVALQALPPGKREAILYVHGFNNTFADGVLRISQMAHDFGFNGVAVHYSWPSAGNPLGYAYDRDSVLYSRDGLEELIRQVKGAGAERVVLVAHSVGSLLVMETLRQMAVANPGSVGHQIEGVVLISPDIDVDVFRSQVARIGKLPDPFGIFISKRDRALSLSARLTGQRNRLGNVESVDQVADLEVTVIDVTGFSRGSGHFTAGSSPAVISIFAQAGDLEAAFKGDNAGRTGLFPGTVLTVQNATTIILSPVTELLRCGQPNTPPCFAGDGQSSAQPPAQSALPPPPPSEVSSALP